MAEPAPALAAWYRGRVQDGFFDTPRFERRFLGEIAWPLGDARFWRQALEDWDTDTREIPIVIASVHPRRYLGFFGGADAFLRVPFAAED